jgi:hypothetical protein
MSHIPDKNVRACLAVLYRACIHARLLGYEGEAQGLAAERCKLLADLMDAVHNLPHLAMRWPECDESLLRAMLQDFDTRWPSANIGLLATYDATLATASS